MRRANFGGSSTPRGEVKIVKLRSGPTSTGLFSLIKQGLPLPSVDEYIRRWRLRNLRNLLRGVRRVLPAHLMGLAHMQGALWLQFIPRGNMVRYNLGLASLRVVTNTGVAFIVDGFQNGVELESMKYHGFGTGVGDEAAGDSALGTELTTEYAVDNTRPTGSTEEGATANIFKTIATLTIDSGTPAVTEHGIFSQAATGGGVLLDRSKFAAINLVASDSIVATYSLTLSAGS